MPEDFVKIEKTNSNDLCCDIGSTPRYPWGTRLDFENDLVDNLEIDGLAVGDVVEIKAFAFVQSKSIRESDSPNGSHKDISLQLTAMKVSREESDRAEELYGS